MSRPHALSGSGGGERLLERRSGAGRAGLAVWSAKRQNPGSASVEVGVSCGVVIPSGSILVTVGNIAFSAAASAISRVFMRQATMNFSITVPSLFWGYRFEELLPDALRSRR
jgi:hypothetical protein